MKPDKLKLQSPIWVTHIQPLHRSENEVVCSTAFHEIRLYDIRTQKKPTMNMKLSEMGQTFANSRLQTAETSVISWFDVSSDNKTIYYGSSHGIIAALDLRTGKPLSSLKGPVGSIRAIQLHPSYNPVDLASSKQSIFLLENSLKIQRLCMTTNQKH